MSDTDSVVPKPSDALSGAVEKLIPPRAYMYLFATLPGLFFGTLILVTNPEPICQLVAKAQDGLRLTHYELVGLALIFSFVIGNASMLLVESIQLLLMRLYQYSLKSGDLEIPDEHRRCWAAIAQQLLSAKYGIDPKTLKQSDWNVLYLSLGVPAPDDVRANFMMMATEAMGWCGLAAMLFAPGLINRYFVAFALFLIAAGLLHAWYVAELVQNPRTYGLLKVRVLLRELGKFAKVGQEQPILKSQANN